MVHSRRYHWSVL